MKGGPKKLQHAFCTSEMRYAQIRLMDVANGPGLRVSVFVTGCTHHCPGCFNIAYQDPNVGTLWTEETTQTLLMALGSDHIDGLTLLGGEPMQNLALIPIIERVRQVFPSLNIWVYSGYTWEEIQTHPLRCRLLDLCDVLVDGRFEQELRTLKLPFRGSSNQRILDLKASREKGKPVWLASYEPDT